MEEHNKQVIVRLPFNRTTHCEKRKAKTASVEISYEDFLKAEASVSSVVSEDICQKGSGKNFEKSAGSETLDMESDDSEEPVDRETQDIESDASVKAVHKEHTGFPDHKILEVPDDNQGKPEYEGEYAMSII